VLRTVASFGPDGSRAPVWFKFDERRPLAFFAKRPWTSACCEIGQIGDHCFSFGSGHGGISRRFAFKPGLEYPMVGRLVAVPSADDLCFLMAEETRHLRNERHVRRGIIYFSNATGSAG
jgi:hypothetical protein